MLVCLFTMDKMCFPASKCFNSNDTVKRTRKIYFKAKKVIFPPSTDVVPLIKIKIHYKCNKTS